MKSTGERKAFKEGLAQFDENERVYNTPVFNGFGQRLKPHYCRHGVANLWSDYDSICQYCEDGISRTEYAMLGVYRYRQAVRRKFLQDCHDELQKLSTALVYKHELFMTDLMVEVHAPIWRMLGVL